MKTHLAAILALALTTFYATSGASPVNINSASAEQIAQALNGIGESKARAIVAHRTENGPFQSAEDLTAVKGIGSKTVERNKEDIRL